MTASSTLGMNLRIFLRCSARGAAARWMETSEPEKKKGGQIGEDLPALAR